MNDDKEYCEYCYKMVDVINRDQRKKDEGGFVLDFILDCGHAKTREPTYQELD